MLRIYLRSTIWLLACLSSLLCSFHSLIIYHSNCSAYVLQLINNY